MYTSWGELSEKGISIFNSSKAQIGFWISALCELVLQGIFYPSRLSPRLEYHITTITGESYHHAFVSPWCLIQTNWFATSQILLRSCSLFAYVGATLQYCFHIIFITLLMTGHDWMSFSCTYGTYYDIKIMKYIIYSTVWLLIIYSPLW